MFVAGHLRVKRQNHIHRDIQTKWQLHSAIWQPARLPLTRPLLLSRRDQTTDFHAVQTMGRSHQLRDLQCNFLQHLSPFCRISKTVFLTAPHQIPYSGWMQVITDDIFNSGLSYFWTGNITYAEVVAKRIRDWWVNPETRMTPHLQYADWVKGHEDPYYPDGTLKEGARIEQGGIIGVFRNFSTRMRCCWVINSIVI